MKITDVNEILGDIKIIRIVSSLFENEMSDVWKIEKCKIKW